MRKMEKVRNIGYVKFYIRLGKRIKRDENGEKMKINRSLSVSGILLTLILILPCSGATGLCNGVSYDKDIYRCEFGELIGKCKGKDYYAAYDKCVNGIVVNGTASSNNSSTFTDSRDGKTYKLVKIGKQTWMAENLNYAASGSKCYDNKILYCDKYGRLYDWSTARVVCPKGWHLPSDGEWQTLVDFAGGKDIAGTKLKTKSGWSDFKGKSSNGSDTYGFSALPGGFAAGILFFFAGDIGFWWSSSENSSDNAYYLGIFNGLEPALCFNIDKRVMMSVRCLRD